VPAAGDSKKAIDEYSSEIFLGGQHSFMSYNVCEDSLLAAPLLLDLALLAELLTRVTFAREKGRPQQSESLISFLGYFLKNPQMHGPRSSGLFWQRERLCGLLRAVAGWGQLDSLHLAVL
jgi:myo-inositol-1-phosphate synthase